MASVKFMYLRRPTFQHGVSRDDVFLQCGKSDGGLDGGARNGTVGVREFLVDDGKNAAGVGIHATTEPL